MKESKIRNIIGFTFNMHQHTVFRLGSPEYIMEKWNKFIGTKPISNLVDVSRSEQHSVNPIYPKDYILEWTKKWRINNDELIEVKEIAYLIIILNRKPLINTQNGEISWDLDSLILEFSRFIDLEDVNDIVYNHLHVIIKSEIDKFIKINQRSMNLSILLDKF